MSRPRIAILASGGGTTAEAYINAAAKDDYIPEVALVIFSNQKAGIAKVIAELNIKLGSQISCINIDTKTHPPASGETVPYGRQSAGEEAAILDELEKHEVDLVALMGYMKHIGRTIVEKYGWQGEYSSIYQARMVNTHPGLLPETKGLFGLNVQKKVLQNKSPKAGHCLFAVDEQYDNGPVIVEHYVEVKEDDTTESLFERVKASERKHLPNDIADFMSARKAYLAGEKA